MLEKEKIERINELARKKREQGLSLQETCEQHNLRQEYLASFRTQVSSMLDSIHIQDEDGSIHPLPKKYPN